MKKYLSDARLNPYYRVCMNNKQKAHELYQLNLRLASSFLPLVSILEVSLRNAIDDVLTHYSWKTELVAMPLINDSDLGWVTPLKKVLEKKNEELKRKLLMDTNEKSFPKGYRFPLNEAVNVLEQNEKQLVNAQKTFLKNILKRRFRSAKSFKDKNLIEQFNFIKESEEKSPYLIKVTKNQIIANSNFSFWVSFFKEDMYKCLRGTVINIFINKGTKNREKIAKMLEDVQDFRNRIAHNEPIILRNRELNTEFPQKIYDTISELLQMLGEDLYTFSRETYAIHTYLFDVKDFVKKLPDITK